MTLHVYNNPTGTLDADDGVNIWITDVPADFSDDDVHYNVEKWAKDGDKVAQSALDLMKAHKRDWFSYKPRDPTVRVYLDE